MTHPTEPLQHPTLADQALAAFWAKTKTAQLAKFATHFGATRDDESGTIVWVFPDDTRHVIAMGWHCFSLHCKYARHTNTTYCTKHDTDCRLENCAVFRNGRPV